MDEQQEGIEGAALVACDTGAAGDAGLALLGVMGGIPEEGKAALAMRAFGLGPRAIARRLGTSEGRVRRMLKQYDPGGVATSADMERKMVLGAMLERLAFEILIKIKKEDLEEIPVRDRVAIVRDCVAAADKLGMRQIVENQADERVIRELQGIVGVGGKDGQDEVEHK